MAVGEAGSGADEGDEVGAFTARHRAWAASTSLNAIAGPAAREPDVGHLIRARLAGGWEDVAPAAAMNTAIKRISAPNVHERPALRGPRDELRNLADTVDGLLERPHSA